MIAKKIGEVILASQRDKEKNIMRRERDKKKRYDNSDKENQKTHDKEKTIETSIGEVMSTRKIDNLNKDR